MEFKDCLKAGLIKENKNAMKRVEKEVEISEKFFRAAKKNLGIRECEMTVIAAYNSLFHCCRALLFEKGYTERNHFCLNIALQNLYPDDKVLLEFLNNINKIRISRHQVQYRGDMSNSREAEFVLDLTRRFLSYTQQKLKFQKYT